MLISITYILKYLTFYIRFISYTFTVQKTFYKIYILSNTKNDYYIVQLELISESRLQLLQAFIDIYMDVD